MGPAQKVNMKILRQTVARNGHEFSQPLYARLGNIRVFNRKNAADAAARAAIQLNEVKVVELFVLKLFKDVNHVFNPVCGKVALLQKSCGFASAACPADSDDARIVHRIEVVALELIHCLNKNGIDVLYCKSSVDNAAVIAKRIGYRRPLCRAGRDEKNADVLVFKSGFFPRRFPCKPCGKVNGGKKRKNVFDKIRKPCSDKPQNRRTRRGDDRLLQRFAFNHAPRSIADKLCRL